MLKCGASALGQGTIVLTALPGYEANFPDSTSVTRFQTSKIQSSPCGDELTIWGWMLDERKRTPSEIARLGKFYSANPTILSLPVGMEVTAIIEGFLNPQTPPRPAISSSCPPLAIRRRPPPPPVMLAMR